MQDRLRKSEYEVRDITGVEARSFIAEHHYAKGSSNTSVFRHGLFRKGEDRLLGAVIWLPPTRRACESVNRSRWKDVLSLSRMAIAPGVPKNACSYLLGASVRDIKKHGRYVSLVTYADRWQEHDGHVYSACGWFRIGEMPGSDKWLDENGRQVARLSTRSRSVKQMEELGYTRIGKFGKVKYTLHLIGGLEGRLLKLGDAIESLRLTIKERKLLP